MTRVVLIAAGTLVSCVFAQIISDPVQAIGSLPICAQACITSAFSFCNCQLTDFSCICHNNAFIPSVRSCVQKSCSINHLQTILDVLSGYCAPPSSSTSVRDPPATSTTTSSSSTSSTHDDNSATMTAPPPSWTGMGGFAGNWTYGNGTSRNATKTREPPIFATINAAPGNAGGVGSILMGVVLAFFCL